MVSKFFRKNIWLKLASVILAVILWFFVVSSNRETVVMDMPVEFTNLPPAYEIVDHQSTIKIAIEGQARLVQKLNRDDVRIVIDLSTAGTGKSYWAVSEDNIDLPGALFVSSIFPREVSLTIREKTE